jgi:hypothetical protein
MGMRVRERGIDIVVLYCGNVSCSVEIDDSVDSVTEVDVAAGCGEVEWGGKGQCSPMKGVGLYACRHKIIGKCSDSMRIVDIRAEGNGVRPCSLHTHIQGQSHDTLNPSLILFLSVSSLDQLCRSNGRDRSNLQGGVLPELDRLSWSQNLVSRALYEPHKSS